MLKALRTTMLLTAGGQPTPQTNWDVFDFSCVSLMAPVKRGFTITNPLTGGDASFRTRLCPGHGDGILVCSLMTVSGVPDFIGAYDFDEGHACELDHMITTPTSYKNMGDLGNYLYGGVSFFAFGGDGTTAYAYSNTGNAIEQGCSMSTPFDLSTISVSSSYGYAGGLPAFVGYSPDGMSCYIHSEDNPNFEQRLLVNPYDNLTKPYRGTKSVNLDTITGQSGMPWKGVSISPDGKYAVCLSGNGTGRAWKFRFGTPWDVETLELVNQGYMGTWRDYGYITPRTCVINSSGTRMLVGNTGQNADYQGIWEYDLTNLG